MIILLCKDTDDNSENNVVDGEVPASAPGDSASRICSRCKRRNRQSGSNNLAKNRIIFKTENRCGEISFLTG